MEVLRDVELPKPQVVCQPGIWGRRVSRELDFYLSADFPETWRDLSFLRQLSFVKLKLAGALKLTFSIF